MIRLDLDHNATSPLDPEVFEAMRPFWLVGGNPESRHDAGRAARRGLDQARDTVARVLNADPAEVVFTSGGTEANNLALLGRVGTTEEVGHLVSSPIEHPAVAAPVSWLEARGWGVDRPPVDEYGRADASLMARAIGPDTRLATLMLANNEVGTIQPVAELARLAAAAGVPVHTDAVQAVGRIPVDFHALGVSTLALGGHKLHGPPGVGALLVRRGEKIGPLLHGGGQESGLRSGTVPVPLCVGLAAALAIWQREAGARAARWRSLRERLKTGLIASLGDSDARPLGPDDPAEVLPQTLTVAFPGRDGDALLMRLDLAGVRASIGSACASGSTTAPPTLVAMGVPADSLRSSVRFSFGATTTEADIDEATRRIVEIVRRVPVVVPRCSPHAD
jgi:cysteine desulfurase